MSGHRSSHRSPILALLVCLGLVIAGCNAPLNVSGPKGEGDDGAFEPIDLSGQDGPDAGADEGSESSADDEEPMSYSCDHYRDLKVVFMNDYGSKMGPLLWHWTANGAVDVHIGVNGAFTSDNITAVSQVPGHIHAEGPGCVGDADLMVSILFGAGSYCHDSTVVLEPLVIWGSSEEPEMTMICDDDQVKFSIPAPFIDYGMIQLKLRSGGDTHIKDFGENFGAITWTVLIADEYIPSNNPLDFPSTE